MKRTILALAAFGGMLAMGLTACGDDVINVTNEDVYSVVDELDSTACTKDNEGDMALVKPTGKLYACKDGEWTAVNAVEAIQLRCKSEALKDSTGYKILCDDEEIGVVRNGKDGSSSIGKDGKSAYELAKEAGFKGTEEEWLKTLNGKNGKSAYETAKDNGFKGTEEEWVKTLFGKDGKSAYELAKKSGFDGSEEEWLESLKGKDGKNINADSLSTELSESISKMLIDSLKCKIDSSWTDEAKAEVNVQISCGDGTSIITMPTIIPNKNLKNHYKKHVVVRFPVNSQKTDDAQDVYATMWAGVQGNSLAELTVLEVDSSFVQTGKNFVADMIAMNGKPFVTVEEVNGNTRSYSVVRLEGDIDVTNLINSFAQLRITLDLKANMWGATNSVVFNTAIDFDDKRDTVVIDFLTDYKAARVKELLKKDMSFAAASAQANKELVAALHISETPDEYPVLEHHLPAEMGLNEHFASVVWPMALLDQPNVQNFNTVYNNFRASFAQNGDFKTAVETTYDGEDYSMFLVDMVTMLMNRNFQAYNHGDYGGCEYCSGSFDSVAIYKVVQAEYKDAYKLPEATNDTVVKVTGGYFDYFLYNSTSKVWVPVDYDYFSEYTYFLWEDFVTLLSGEECNADNAGKSVLFTLNNEEVAFVCKLNNGEYYWDRQDEGLNNIYCDNKEAGAYGYTEGYYYRCVESEKEGVGLIANSVSSTEYEIGAPCTDNSKDTLYATKYDFYRCVGSTEASENTQAVAAHYQSLYFDEENDYQFIASQQAGACAESNDGKIEVIYKTPEQQEKALCSKGKWVPYGYIGSLGVCDLETMNKGELKYINVKEWQMSTLTGYGYVKCDCKYYDAYSQNVDVKEYSCNWTDADELDVTFNKACGFADTALHAEGYRTLNGNQYSCQKRSWMDYGPSGYYSYTYAMSWSQVTPTVACNDNHDIIAPDPEVPQNTTYRKLCKYKDSIYVERVGYEEWRDTKIRNECGSPAINGSTVPTCTRYSSHNRVNADGEIIKPVNDFYSDGEKWIEAADEQEFCDHVHPEAREENTPDFSVECLFMQEYYVFSKEADDGKGKWIKGRVLEEYCDDETHQVPLLINDDEGGRRAVRAAPTRAVLEPNGHFCTYLDNVVYFTSPIQDLYNISIEELCASDANSCNVVEPFPGYHIRHYTGLPVNDFYRNPTTGKLKEPADEQEYCDALYDKDEQCVFMYDPYINVDNKWVFDANSFCLQTNDNGEYRYSEKLTYGGYWSSSSYVHCSDQGGPACITDENKLLCHTRQGVYYGSRSSSSGDFTWVSTVDKCGDPASASTQDACMFLPSAPPNSDYSNEPTVYEQQGYLIVGNGEWIYAYSENDYCNALVGNGNKCGVICEFDFYKFRYHSSSQEWRTGENIACTE